MLKVAAELKTPDSKNGNGKLSAEGAKKWASKTRRKRSLMAQALKLPMQNLSKKTSYQRFAECYMGRSARGDESCCGGGSGIEVVPLKVIAQGRICKDRHVTVKLKIPSSET